MINLHTDALCPFSHQARLMLSIKDLNYKSHDNKEDLSLLNPENTTPVLVDVPNLSNKKENLVIYQMQIMFEFLEDHIPHPQTIPIEAVDRARIRSLSNNFDREIFNHLRELHELKVQNQTRKKYNELKEKIEQSLDLLSKLFLQDTKKRKIEFLFNDSLSILDIKILPLLWRLDFYEIEIPTSWKNMMSYAENLFDTKEFITSLSLAERNLYSNSSNFVNNLNPKPMCSLGKKIY